MPTSLLEIVDLGDGEIVLQRADDDMVEGADDDSLREVNAELHGEDAGEKRDSRREPLVTIRFSDETRMYIMDQGLEVAKAMIQAGIQAAAQVAEQAEVEIESTSMETAPRVLH